MNTRRITCAIVLGLMAAVAAAEEDQPRELQHNPFSRPALIEGSPDSAETATPSETSITLRATMVSDRTRLADVGGRVMQPGESVDGLRLIRVYEDRAVFERDGRETIVFVRTDDTTTVPAPNGARRSRQQGRER